MKIWNLQNCQKGTSFKIPNEFEKRKTIHWLREKIKMRNNDLQIITQKAKYRKTRIPVKPWGGQLLLQI